ncbi:MAG: zinc-ribbon domain-containing protein [Anaerolineaceae bacterium]
MNQQEFCEQCGAELEAGSKFCEECGRPVPPDEKMAPTQLQPLFPHQRSKPQTQHPALEHKTRMPPLWMIVGTIVSCSSMVCGLLTLVLGPGLTSSRTGCTIRHRCDFTTCRSQPGSNRFDCHP